jgi:hypothetical protein
MKNPFGILMGFTIATLTFTVTTGALRTRGGLEIEGDVAGNGDAGVAGQLLVLGDAGVRGNLFVLGDAGFNRVADRSIKLVLPVRSTASTL